MQPIIGQINQLTERPCPPTGGSGVPSLTTLNLDALKKITEQAQKLQAILKDVVPMIELIRTAELQLPTDRLIRAGEAANILGVSKSTVGHFVKAGLLTPLYVNSEQKKFWLSEVKALPRKKAWAIRD